MENNSPGNPVGRIFRHHKGALYYVDRVVHASTNSRNNGHDVIYLSLERGTWHSRDIVEFFEVVEWPDRKKRPRFELA